MLKFYIIFFVSTYVSDWVYKFEIVILNVQSLAWSLIEIELKLKKFNENPI